MLRQQRPVDLLRDFRQQRALHEAPDQALQRSADAHATAEGVALGTGKAVRPGSFASAAVAWMSATFVLCYLALPLGRIALGLSTQTSDAVLGVALASSAGLLGALVLLGSVLAVTRPQVAVNVDPDRILSATSGSLLVWGLLHNTLPGLMFFSDMASGELGTFVASNFLESALFGVVLASITRSGRGAFALGALFQTLLFGLSYMAMIGMYLMLL